MGRILITFMPPSEYKNGLRLLAKENRPLWIFSLNYDLVVECLCAAEHLPIHSGLPEQTTLPKRDALERIIGSLDVEMIREDRLKQGLVFPLGNDPRVNLIKLHGGLDIFTVRDGKDLVKVLPKGNAASMLQNMVSLRKEVALQKSPNPRSPLPSGEFLYKDATGNLQFLQHSIVTGAFKFDQRQSQVLPEQILNSFKGNLNYLSTLVVIGYSFGDAHINAIIREWIEWSEGRRIEIIDPYSIGVPGFLLHVSLQVEVKKIKTRDFFGSIKA